MYQPFKIKKSLQQATQHHCAGTNEHFHSITPHVCGKPTVKQLKCYFSSPASPKWTRTNIINSEFVSRNKDLYYQIPHLYCLKVNYIKISVTIEPE